MGRRKFTKSDLPLSTLAPSSGTLLKALSASQTTDASQSNNVCISADGYDYWQWNYTLVAIGHAGISMANHIDKKSYGLSQIIAIDSNIKELQNAKADQKLLVQEPLKDKPTSIADAQKLGEMHLNCIKDALKDSFVVIIVTGMGGVTGAGLSSGVAQAARDIGAIVFVFALMPFDCEGPGRKHIALEGVAELQKTAHSVSIINNDELANNAEEKVTTLQSLDHAGSALKGFLRNTAGRLRSPGLVGIDLEDVHAMFAGTGHTVIGKGIGSGHERAAQAARNALHNLAPWFNDRSVSTASVDVRFDIDEAHVDNVVAEITEVMHVCNEYLTDEVEVFLSGDIDPSREGVCEVSIILRRNNMLN